MMGDGRSLPRYATTDDPVPCRYLSDDVSLDRERAEAGIQSEDPCENLYWFQSPARITETAVGGAGRNSRIEKPNAEQGNLICRWGLIRGLYGVYGASIWKQSEESAAANRGCYIQTCAHSLAEWWRMCLGYKTLIMAKIPHRVRMIPICLPIELDHPSFCIRARCQILSLRPGFHFSILRWGLADTSRPDVTIQCNAEYDEVQTSLGDYCHRGRFYHLTRCRRVPSSPVEYRSVMTVSWCRH